MSAIIMFAGNGGNVFAAGGADQYGNLFTGGLQLTTTENDILTNYQYAGALTGLWMLVTSNTNNKATTVKSRVNTVDGSQTFSIGISTSGTFQDTTHTDNISASDAINFRMSSATGSGNVTVATVSIKFNATSSTTTVLGYVSASGSGWSTASTTFFAGITAGMNTTNQGTTETRFQFYAGVAGTLEHLRGRVSTNARTSTTTIRCRISGSNSASASVGSGSTGSFSAANSDAVSVGGLLNYSVTTGTGAGTIDIRTITSEYTTTNRGGLAGMGHPTLGLNQTHGVTSYLPIGGCLLSGGGDSTENNERTLTQSAFTASQLSVRLDSNSCNGASSCTLRQNGSDTLLAASMTASTSGRFTDATNTPSISANDTLTFKLVSGGSSGTFDFRTVTMSLTYPQSTALKDLIGHGRIPVRR